MECKRIQWLDTARVIAIISVVLCHSVESVFVYSNVKILDFSFLVQSIVFSAFTFGRLGVPIFLFISGWLLLSKQYDNNRCIHFWKSNWVQLLCVTEVWIVIYYIFTILMKKTPFSISELFEQMLFLKQSSMSHMWYMPMILGIYIFLPFVANVLNTIDKQILYFPMLVMIFYSFVIPSFNVWWGSQQKEMLYSQLSIEFGGGKYGIYIILGSLFCRGMYPRVKKFFLWLGFLSMFFCTVLFQIFLLRRGYEYYVWYDFIILFIAAICLFLILKGSNLCKEKTVLYGLIEDLAKDSFGIYLIHRPILDILLKYLQLYTIHPLYKMMLFWGITLIMSWGIVECFSRISQIEKNIFT